MSLISPLDHARDLFARGLAPIPVPHGSKAARISGWPSLRLGLDDLPQHFNGAPANIGVLLGEPSGWLVDVDLDHPRALALASAFLPSTDMKWGRDSKPKSHWIYRVRQPAKTRKLASKAAGTIVELRSTGCQTIAPGSTHPSGEPVRWDEQGEPATIDPDVLNAALEALANAVREELGEGTEAAGSNAHPIATGREGSAYGRAALRREATLVAGALQGTRNDALNRAAFNVGTLIGSGEVDRIDAESTLHAAALACGLPDAEARRSIASGIAAGFEHPRQRAVSRVTSLVGKTTSTGRARREPGPAFTLFPVEVLPEPIRCFVIDAARAIGCDPSFIALPLLSALASAIGNTHRIELKREWTEPPILWTAIVGESGTHKTPAFKMAMTAIRKVQARAFKEHDAAMSEWEAKKLRYEAELATWNRNAAKAGPGDGCISAPPEKPALPIARRFIVSDTTVEALAPILLGNPRGVLLARDELAGWIGSFDRYAKAGRAGADSAHWLSIHNGEALTIDRKTGIPPTIHVPSASVSITGGIQPGILARAMGQEHRESGLLARLLFALPPRRVKRWTEADVGTDTAAAVAAVFDRLLSLTMEVDPASADPINPDLRPRLLRLADDGKAAWVRFYDTHATEQVELSGDLSAAWSKLQGCAARLALVVHLTRWAAGDATLRDSERIDEVSIAAGVVLTRWFGDEARRVYALLSESDDDRETRRLVEWLDQRGGTVTPRDLTHGLRAYRGDPDAAERALSALVEAGMGRWEAEAHGPKGGRPARRFRLVSTVTVTETPTNAGQDMAYGDGDAGDASSDAGDRLGTR